MGYDCTLHVVDEEASRERVASMLDELPSSPDGAYSRATAYRVSCVAK